MSFRIVNGNTHTEAGWRCCNRDECDIVRIPDLTYVDTAPLRKGPPLVILGAWIYWYDRNVEEIFSPVWGWSLDNDVLGQPGRNNGSNHLSGTAVDIWAPRYPWGTYRMSADKIAKVEEGLRLFEGSVFWGRRWSKPDEMHYQVSWREGDPRNDAFAQKLLNGYLGIYGPSKTPQAVEILAAAAGISISKATQILPTMVDGLRLAQCNTVQRIAQFIAHTGHESDGYNATEEYAKNGRYAPYIGRTWIMITWDYHYRDFSEWAHARGMVPTPDYFVANYRALADLRWAGIGAAWYWTEQRPMNALVDAGESATWKAGDRTYRGFEAVTAAINGGLNGLQDRRNRFDRALALGDQLLTLIAGEDDFMSALSDAEQREMLDLLRQQAKYRRPSKSAIRHLGEGDVDTCAGFAWAADGLIHPQFVLMAAKAGHMNSIALLHEVATADLSRYPDRAEDKQLAIGLLAEVERTNPEAAQAYLSALSRGN